jgi:hypothetical protein
MSLYLESLTWWIGQILVLGTGYIWRSIVSLVLFRSRKVGNKELRKRKFDQVFHSTGREYELRGAIEQQAIVSLHLILFHYIDSKRKRTDKTLAIPFPTCRIFCKR